MQNIFWSREQDRGWEGGGGVRKMYYGRCVNIWRMRPLKVCFHITGLRRKMGKTVVPLNSLVV